MKQISILVLLLTSLLSTAQTVTWDGGGGNTNWHNPLNWDTNTVPCNTCTAVVDGAVVVNISANDTIKELRVLNGAFFFIGVGATFVVTGGYNAIDIAGSSLSNNGLLKINLFTNRAISAASNANLTNTGDIEISANPGGGSSQVGVILSNSSFNNQVGSNLLIEYIKSNASISTSIGGSFVNAGDINISYSAVNSIRNSGNFENKASGQVIILYSTDHGIKNPGTFLNRGNISVFTVFTSNPTTQDAIGLSTTGTFTNTNTAVLSVDNTAKYGIEIIGTFTNEGVIKVKNNQPNAIGLSNGIIAYTDLINIGSISVENIDGIGIRLVNPSNTTFNSGSITMRNTSKSALDNDQNFLNSGALSVNLSGGHGIDNGDSLKNTGTISISKTTNIGILNKANLINYTSGSIDISDGDSVSIENRFLSNIINEGSIVIDSLKKTAVINDGNFNNQGGNLIIEGFDPMLNSGRGIESSGTLTNSGDISIIKSNQESVNLTGSGTFLNDSDGNVYIQKPKGHGIFCTQNAENRGAIHVDSTDGAAKYGIYFDNSTSTFLNLGLIKINHSERGFSIINGFLGNTGTIQIKHTIYGISNNGNLYNFPSGFVSIDSCELGLYNTNTFSNEGTFNGSNLDDGIDNFDKFTNYNTIALKRLTNRGIRNSSSSTLFKNEPAGIIHISVGFFGLFCNDTLINNGTILIDSITSIGISNLSTFINNGNISLKNDLNGLNGLWNFTNYLFHNTEKGIININGRLQNYGVIKNEGLISQNFSGPNAILSSFQNIGVFVDTKDIQNPDANFVNTGLLIKPLKGEVSVGIKEMNIVNRSGVTTFSPMATWYINPILSVTGGTFSATDDSYTPNANAPFADSLYFNVSTASITRAVKIPILKTPVCSANPTATFTQAVSTDWHIAENWSNGKVPDYCTIAIIPNTKQCTITTGRKARAYRILSDTGSVFDADLGVVLEVENN